MPVFKPSRRALLSMAAAMPALTLSATRVPAQLAAPVAANPAHFRFSLGQAQFTVISDGSLSLPASLASVESGEAEDGGVLRGTADVAAYCAEAVSLYEALVKPSVEVVLLSGKLATMMGSSQLLQCLHDRGWNGGLFWAENDENFPLTAGGAYAAMAAHSVRVNDVHVMFHWCFPSTKMCGK